MASRRPPRPLNSPPPSLRTYLSLVQASAPPFRTCNTLAHALGALLARSGAAPVPRRRRVVAAAGEGQTPPPFFPSLWFARGSPSLHCCRLSSPAPVGPRPDHTGEPPGPPPLPIFSAIASPSPSCSPASPSHGEQYPALNFSSSTALWRAHKLTGAAAPPPFSAGRRRGTINPQDPPFHVRTHLRYEMHQLVDKMMAGSTVQGRCRRASAARRRSPANPAATPACTRSGSLDR
jgi:hypothetical protein